MTWTATWCVEPGKYGKQNETRSTNLDNDEEAKSLYAATLAAAEILNLNALGSPTNSYRVTITGHNSSDSASFVTINVTQLIDDNA